MPAVTCCRSDVICSTEKRFRFTACPPGPWAGLCSDTRPQRGPKDPEPLRPSGIKAMTDHILEAWKEDIRIRTESMEESFPEHNDSGYKVDVREIGPGVVYQDRNVTVKAFSVSH